uniref:Uncharacterized protein n=1 Tax=Mimivirus LCMiAC01 TaxID=2506608 RepID=A0A481YZ40_9VIRU|nr:MAG: hypothetical protein LCMiAC01_01990 [Mimivirus LCMiAC01]
MKLYLIDKKGCHHTMDLMPGILIVYEMKMKFDPWLQIEFLPERYGQGIILIAGNEVIRRNYTFDKPKDKVELEKLIWHYIRKYHNPVDITDKNGCLTDFRKMGRFKVIQGWQAKKRDMKKDTCCHIDGILQLEEERKKLGNWPILRPDIKIKNRIGDMITNDIMEELVLHPVYGDNTKDELTRETCMKVRGENCGDNFPPNTPQFRRCMAEITWLCTHGYPRNKRTEVILTYREKLKNKILDYLKKNNLRVNKQVLDVILSAGFFERVRNRMGNKYTGYKSTRHSVDDAMNEYNYYATLIEGYDQKETNYGIYIIIFIILLSIFVYYAYKQKK